MIRRLLRIGSRIGVFAGVGFALFKVVQNRRTATTRMPSGDNDIVPTRPNQPLVDPSMLQGVELRKGAGGEAEPIDGHGGPAPAPAEAPAPDAAAPAASAVTTELEAPAEPQAEQKTPQAPATSPARTWVDPKGSFCPSSHPVKAKLSSGIFHLPGMTAYERTTPDRCYADQESAEADGLRRAKR